MAFKNEDLFNMENIVKATGLSEDKLADLIIAKEEEGWTNAEIAQLLYENMDNEQYKSKAQDELDALYSLGFNPGPGYNPQGGKRGYTEYVEPEDPEWLDWTTHTNHPGNSTPKDNGWTDLKKIGDSWMNYRDNTDPMYRVGLVNAIFGDPSMLGQYYQMQNQNVENEKNRQVQEAYNKMFKDIDGKTELARLGKEYVQANDEPTRLYLKQEMRRQAAKAGVPENEIEDFISTYTGAKDSQLETDKRQRANYNALANEIRKNGIPSRTVDDETGLSPWDQMADKIEETDISDEQRESLYSLLSGETKEEKDAKDKEARDKAKAEEDKKRVEELRRQRASVSAKIKAKKEQIKKQRDMGNLSTVADLEKELENLETELKAIK